MRWANKSLIVEMLAADKRDEIAGPTPLSMVTGSFEYILSLLLVITTHFPHFSPECQLPFFLCNSAEVNGHQCHHRHF